MVICFRGSDAVSIYRVQAAVTSKGALFLDDCDFSRSTAPELVYSEPGSTVVIRNAVLGDNNCEPHRVEHDAKFLLFVHAYAGIRILLSTGRVAVVPIRHPFFVIVKGNTVMEALKNGMLPHTWCRL